MINDEVSIYNLALNSIGARNNVVSPTERSREAEVCRLWYSVVRDQVLASAPWPAATALRRLATFASSDETDWAMGDPAPGYAYAYGLPEDVLRPQHLTSFAPFTVMSYDANALAIMTNQASAILKYTKRQQVIKLWDPEMQMAIVAGLAANICMPLTGKAQRAQLMLNQANSIILSARVGAANTGDEQYDSLPDWITARGYQSCSGTPTRYLHPFGPLLSVSAGVN